MRILTVTNMWPSAARPHWGVFVKSQVESLVAAGIDNTLYEIEGWKSAGEYFKAAHRIPSLARQCRWPFEEIPRPGHRLAPRRWGCPAGCR